MSCIKARIHDYSVQSTQVHLMTKLRCPSSFSLIKTHGNPTSYDIANGFVDMGFCFTKITSIDSQLICVSSKVTEQGNPTKTIEKLHYRVNFLLSAINCGPFEITKPAGGLLRPRGHII